MGLGSEFRIELAALRRELALLDVKKAGILAQIGAIQKMCSHSNTDTFRDECLDCGERYIRVRNVPPSH